MPSNWVLAETLRSITTIKLKELCDQRANFEENKSYLLFAADAESDLPKKVKTLLEGCQALSIQKRGEKPNLFYDDLAQFLEQAKYDPSISETLLRGEAKLRRELDFRSLRYDYASVYSELLTEWLKDTGPRKQILKLLEGKPKVNEKQAYEKIWEAYVFDALPIDQDEITNHLSQLFCSTAEARTSLENLRQGMRHFEETLTVSNQVNHDGIRWCVDGLLRSDLLNEKKKAALTDISNHKESMVELADVLNMRMSSIDTWTWPKTGVDAEPRRQINGKYRIFHDEDLIDSLLLEYLGRKWSVKFKSALATLSELDVATLTPAEKERRKYVLCPVSDSTLSQKRHQVFQKENFMSQLLATESEVLPGYEDNDQVDEVNVRRSHTDIKQSLLHLLSTEIILNSRLHMNLCIIRSDFKKFGPSLSHSTILTVMKFFGVSPKWLGVFRTALEGTSVSTCLLCV